MKVLVTETKNLFFEGLSKDVNKLFSLKFFFEERDLVEHNFNYKQLIPYCLIYNSKTNKLAYYERKNGEERLNNFLSIGYGGHIEEKDMSFYEDVSDAIKNCALRELFEEVPDLIKYLKEFKLIGCINNNSTEVDRVHVGVVLLFYVDLDESTLSSINWISLDEINELLNYCENWSVSAYELLLEELNKTDRERQLYLIKLMNDYYGFVQLIDIMGTDEDIAIAAKTSYGKSYVTKKNAERLINYLIKHRHTSPFEMCELKFRIRIPMDAWRQMVRHRTASINERSTRYTEALTRFYRRGKNWNKQSLINKQGSADPVDENTAELLSKNEKELHKVLLEEYQRRLSLGVSKEQARKDLPLSTYTEAIWKIDLHNLLHFLKLRLSNDAQYEIRTYAQKIKEFISVLFPITHKAFEEHHLFSTTFSRKEFQILKNYIDLENLLKNHKHEFDEKELFEFISKIK